MGRPNVESVNELYGDKALYTSKDMFSPPAERLPHVIRFELTTGCDWGRCTYCGGFDGVRHAVRTQEEYQNHVDSVWERVGKGPLASSLRRMFIGGGNALAVPTEQLAEAINYTGKRFVEHTGGLPKRISLYGRTQSVLQQGSHGLRRLYESGKGFGLDLFYWGVESGSTELLDYVRKGCSQEEILKAAQEIHVARHVKSSVMIMPGLGGDRFYGHHVGGTVRVLGEIRPEFLTFMGINASPRNSYVKQMAQEERLGTNRPLTDMETAQQMIEIIADMPVFDTKIGCFESSIDGVGYNPLPFGSVRIRTKQDKNYLVERLMAMLPLVGIEL